jgi:hypothetical protein
MTEQKQRSVSKVSVKDLLNADLIRPGEVLRFYGREGTRAHVNAQGLISYEGVEYSSLSAAAKAISGHSLNGWVSWYVSSPDGRSWVKIAELRKNLE